MKLDTVVPWGRSMEEYQRMFALTDSDRSRRMLGVGDGPASFNAEMTQAGYSVISIDPIYQFTKTEIAGRIEDTYNVILEQLRLNAGQYQWTDFNTVEELGAHRMASMNRFLADYEDGCLEGRYLPERLPATSFADGAFELILCSHLLFLYSAQLDEDFHRQSVRELLRVGNEVRIFPLVDLSGQLSPYVRVVEEDCRQAVYQAVRVEVPYRFQRNAHQMLRIFNLPNA